MSVNMGKQGSYKLHETLENSRCDVNLTPKKTNPHQPKIHISTPPKFNIDPEKWWLEDEPFLLGFGNFSGANCFPLLTP